MWWRSRYRAVLPFLIGLIVLIQAGTLLADATDFSGLRGQELKHSTSWQNLARELLGGGKGKIDSVTVVEDRAESLTVRVSYSGVESTDPLVLTASAEDAKLRRINAIPESSSDVTGPSGEATVVLQLDPNTPEGAKFDQAILAITIGEKGALKQNAVKGFACSKKWEKSIAPENLVINVVAQPIGRSKSLASDKPPVLVATKLALRPIQIAKMSPAPAAKGTVDVKPVTIVKPLAASSIKVAKKPSSKSGTAVMMPNLTVLKRADLVVGLPQDVKNNRGKGPSANAIRLFDSLESDVGLQADDVTDLHPNIYEDANPDSGYFYYLPRAYYLYWDEDTGYALRILYGASMGEDSEQNTVSVAARLTSGLDGSDIGMVRDLLAKYCSSAGRKFKELKPFPFSDMAVSLKGDLGQYNIPAENVSVTGISDIAGMIDISLTTDPVTKENLQMVLTQGLGINGLVTYQSASLSGSGSLEVSIPISIRFADQQSFGSRTFTRTVPFQNKSLYPMKMKHVNILMSENKPVVYSYDLGDTQVPAGAKATIDAGKIPTWLERSDKNLKMWVDCAVVADDEEATARAIDAVTGGVTSVAQSQITFRTLSPLADTGAALVLVTVSSRYFDPKGSSEAVKTVELAQDGATFNVGPIYLIDRQPGDVKPGDPLFRFKLTVVNPDGTSKEGDQWTESNNLTIYIGEAQLQPIIGPSDGG